jgi:hypothetical protein
MYCALSALRKGRQGFFYAPGVGAKKAKNAGKTADCSTGIF